MADITTKPGLRETWIDQAVRSAFREIYGGGWREVMVVPDRGIAFNDAGDLISYNTTPLERRLIAYNLTECGHA